MDETQLPERRRPSKFILTLTITPLVLMTIAANIANVSFAKLATDHPLLLTSLDPRSRNLILVTVHMSALAFFTAAMIRRLIFDPLYFMLGRWYGDAAVRWIAKRSPDLGQLISSVEQWFPRFGPLIVAVYPHPLVIVMAGASKMRMLTFMAYNAIGNVIVLVAVWKLGERFNEPVTSVTDFLARNWIAFTAGGVALMILSSMNRARKGEPSIESVGRIEEELEEELEAEMRSERSDPKRPDPS